MTEDFDSADSSILDKVMKDALCEPLPEVVEQRLRHRIEVARSQLVNRKRTSLTRRHFGWVALAGGASAVAAAIPLMYPRTPVAWAAVATAIREHPWIHFSGIHPKGPRLQFWVSLRLGVFAMKAGDVEYAYYQSKSTQMAQGYRATEGVIRQVAAQRPPGELGYLQLLLDQMANGAETLKVPEPDEILAQTRQERSLDGVRVWEYEFTLKAFDEGHANTYIVVFEVDPQTSLLRKWTRKSLKGGRALILDVDYPDEGPNDIFALGVPKSAELPKHGQ